MDEWINKCGITVHWNIVAIERMSLENHAKWKKPVTKGHVFTVWSYSYEMSRIGRSIETERSSGMAGQGLWGRAMESDHLMSIEFLFGVILVLKNWLWWLCNTVNIVKVTELYTLKWMNYIVYEYHKLLLKKCKRSLVVPQKMNNHHMIQQFTSGCILRKQWLRKVLVHPCS